VLGQIQPSDVQVTARICRPHAVHLPNQPAACPSAFLSVQATYEKLLTEVPKYKMITPSVLSDRLRVRFFA